MFAPVEEEEEESPNFASPNADWKVWELTSGKGTEAATDDVLLRDTLERRRVDGLLGLWGS